MNDSEVEQRARAWIAGDPDEATRAELSALLARRDVPALRERIEGPLRFGTAGLRGLVGAGPARMNRAVVMRATRAVAEHLVARVPDARTRPVVVGYDGRVSSRDLASATIGVLVAARIPVRYFADAVPTPLVAFALNQLSATAGIVITASHNPGSYNGYKLYGENGAQIIAPVDEDVERRIGELGAANAIPVSPFTWGEPGGLASEVPGTFVERYLAEIEAIRPRGPADRALPIVYTPVHGVGGALALAALERAGFTRVFPVPEQLDPDGTFPTVAFPNPEDPATLELAVALAEEKRADLVLANDPDADRLAVCVSTAAGRVVPLTGNQVGVLLGDFLLEKAARAPTPLVVSSIVSSPMLADVAASHGARHEQTLTGFKWIWNAAMALERTDSVRFVFGYEEAIGYSAGHFVRDKDGISAAVLFAELAAEARAAGQSVLERLEALHVKHGVWASAQETVTRAGVDGQAEILRAVDRIATPPPEVGGLGVTRVTDFRAGEGERPPWLGKTPLVRLELGDAGRILVRPSGTEPKLKIYTDLRARAASPAELGAVETELAAKARALARDVARLLGF